MQYRRQPILYAALAAVLCAAAPANAQLIISGSGTSSSVGAMGDGNVIVDRSVLDRLGQPRTLPNLLNPEPAAPSAPITLHPPRPEPSAPKAAKAAKPVKKQVVAKPAPLPKATKPAAPEIAAKAPARAPAAPEKPIVVTSRPAVTDAPKPTAPEPAKPEIADAAKPTVPESVKPAPSEPPKPEIAEAAKPNVSEPPKPKVSEPAKPVVSEPAKPVVSEPAKARKLEPPKPAMTAPAPVTPAPQHEVRSTTLSPAAVVEPRGLVPPPPVPEVATVPPPAEAPMAAEPPKPPQAQPTKPAIVPASVGAAAPKAGYVERAGKASIHFAADQAELPEDARAPLEELARRMEKDPALFLQLLAYAEGSESEASKSRRLSLSRALAVRSYLMNYGLRSSRIDVRALGNRVPEGPADRVDLVVEKR